MIDQKLSLLPQLVAPTASAVIYVVDGGNFYKTTLADLMASSAPQSALQTVIDAHKIDPKYHEYNVMSYGAVGNGIADDTVAIQAAIDACAAAGGGAVHLPAGIYKCNVTLTSGVVLVGATAGAIHGYYPFGGGTTVTQTTLLANAAGAVVDTPVGSIICCGVIGMTIRGLGPATAGNGIHFRNVSRGIIKQVHIAYFADEGILLDAGSSNVFEDILVMDCLMDITRIARAGAIDLAGTDNFMTRVESTAYCIGGKSDANLYCCAIVIRGSTFMMNSVIGEISDIGIVLMGAVGFNTLTNCRADLNWGHGYYITTSRNMFSSCFALNNSQDVTNIYSGFEIAATSAPGNLLSSCTSVSTTANKQKYGFEDLGSYGLPDLDTNFLGCNGSGNITALFSTTDWVGPSPIFTSNVVRVTDTDATPDVTSCTFLVLESMTTPTTITNFDGGVSGQDLYLLGASTVTIQNNANIVTNTGADKVLAVKIYHFKYYRTHWYEVE